MLKPRHKLLTFRLTEDEYLQVKSEASREGARCVSDYARAMLLSAPKTRRTSRFEQRLISLESSIQQIINTLEK